MTGPRSAPARQLDVDTRRADLRRMRTIATLLLVLMIVVFVATTVTTLDWPWLPYVRAFAEAGMVGACADWFAVVALFRHPLGIPIPHTAIIPSNRDRIGPALGRFITNNFLDVKVAHERLVQVDILGRLAHWLNDSIIRGQFVDNVSRILPKILRALPGRRRPNSSVKSPATELNPFRRHPLRRKSWRCSGPAAPPSRPWTARSSSPSSRSRATRT